MCVYGVSMHVCLSCGCYCEQLSNNGGRLHNTGVGVIVCYHCTNNLKTGVGSAMRDWCHSGVT